MTYRASLLATVALAALAACAGPDHEEVVEPTTAPNTALAPTDSASKSVSADASVAAVLGVPQGSSVCRNYQRKLGTLASAQAGAQGAKGQEIKAQVDALKAIIKDACS
jgi:hypothetical protein